MNALQHSNVIHAPRRQKCPLVGYTLGVLVLGALIWMLAASCHGAPGDYWERETIKDVARAYGLNAHQAALLQAIRRVEAGNAGLEFGVGQNFPNHPARRYAAFPELSFRLQAAWAAGTVREHYSSPRDLARFGKQYAEDPRWAAKARHFLSSDNLTPSPKSGRALKQQKRQTQRG